MRTFLDLPVELVLQILSEVDPIDILRLAQVCRLAHAIVSERSVWENTLRCLYRRNSLWEPSFLPLSSLDMVGLKKAALRPHQLQSKLTQSSASADKTLYHVQDRALAFDELDDIQVRAGPGSKELIMGDFVRVQIIPGGRYVVGLADTLLCLWDIKPPVLNAEPQEIVLLDAVGLESEQFFFSISNPTQSSNDTFRFSVYIHEGQELNQRIHVYEVGPLERDYRLRLMGQLYLSGDASLARFWVSKDTTFLYRDTGVLVVWDFVNQRLSSWNLKLGAKRLSCELIDIGNVIICLQPDRLLAWKLPVLHPIQDTPGSVTENCEVDHVPFTHTSFVGPQRIASSPGSARLLLPSRWGHPTRASITVDIIHPPSLRDKGVPLTRLRIEVTPNEDQVHVAHRTTSESSSLKQLHATAGVRPYSMLGNNLYLIGRVPLQPDPENLVIHYSSEFTAHSEGGDGKEETWRTLNCPVEHGVDTCSSICPYSGRFAYVCQYAHEDGFNRIHVVDLLE